MATRLHCKYYDIDSVEYNIYVYDKEYSGSVVTFRTDDQGAVIDYQGEESRSKVPVLTSKCEVGIYIENQDIQDFIEDLNTCYEGQMRMVIRTGAAERWVGIILPDLVQYEDLPFEQMPLFRLTATDGIKRLQTIPYKDTSGPYAGKDSIIAHLTKCIAFIGTTDLITTNGWTLTVATNWKPASIISGDVMKNTSFDHRALYQIDKRGNYKYPSVYRVLEQLCLRFHCQFKMMNGSYFFTQHNYHENSSFNTYLYDSSGALVISGSLAMDNVVNDNFTEKLGGGIYSFFPALNFVQVNYIHFGYINLGRGYTWDEADQPVIPESPTVYTIKAGTSVYFKAVYYFDISFSATRPAYIKFGLNFKVGGNYLKSQVLSYSSGPGIGIYNRPQEITTTSTDNYEVGFLVNVTDAVPDYSRSDVIEFTTIPFTSDGAFLFTIDYIGAYDYDGNIINSGITITWKFSNVEVTPIPNADVEDWRNTRSVTAYNNISGNTEKEVLNLVVGQEFGFGRLEIDDGAGGTDGIDWGLGSSSIGQSIEELLAKEVMRTQGVPIRKLSASIELSMTNIHRTIVHGVKRWIFYKGKYVTSLGLMSGEWYQLNTSGTTSGNTELDWVLDGVDSDGNEVLTTYPVGPGGGLPDPGNQTPDNTNNNAVGSILDALFPRTNADIDSGDTVTQIPVETRTVGGEWKNGQTVTVVDPYTGAQQDFVVTADTQISDTYISVSSEAAAFDFPLGSWIITSQETQGATGGSASSYREEFPSHASSTITVTVNGGILPANPAAIRLFYNSGQIISPNHWNHSGSDITLTFTPDGEESIWVEFNA